MSNNKVMTLGKKKNGYETHFDKELELIGPNLNEFVKVCEPEIRSILQKAADQGWSGGCAPYYINSIADVIKSTLSFRPLTPLTRSNNEWSHRSLENREYFQNKRCSAVFCDGNNLQKNTCYYLDAFSIYVKWQYDLDANLMEYPEQTFGWHGGFWMYVTNVNTSKGEWKFFSSSAYIRSLETFRPNSSNTGFVIPVIEFKSPSDTHNDFYLSLSFEEFYNKNLDALKLYRLKEIPLDDELKLTKQYLDEHTDMIMGWKPKFLKKYLTYGK